MAAYDYIIKETYLIREVLEVFEGNHDRVALVTGENDALIGVVSEGDIIRALSGGQSLYSEVRSFVRPSFLYLKDRDIERAYRIFREKKITLLPVVDADFKVINVITVNDIFDWLEGGGK